MKRTERLFKVQQSGRPSVTWADVVVASGLAAVVYGAIYLAVDAPAVVRGPQISLAPGTLPLYAGLSTARMAAAYALSLFFSIAYGYGAARTRRAERVLLPLLDVLQSVPVLSFLPVVLLSLSAVLPKSLAAEIASVVLIFTSQAWNLTFAWYQSLTTIPRELREANFIFRLNGWLRFKTLQLPFAAISLIWNSMMSWAGGWFFLMAAETFTVGQRDFRLPGLGAYLQEAANQGDVRAVGLGLATLILVITTLDQLVWRPLLAWSDRFKLEMLESADPPTSWFYDALRSSRIIDFFVSRLWDPAAEAFDSWALRRFPARNHFPEASDGHPWALYSFAALAGLAGLFGAFRAARMLLLVSAPQWGSILVGVGATLLRVACALGIALAWTVPVGVVIGTNRRLATWLQPLVQITASVPATALFPIFLLLVLGLPGGLNIAAVLLMLMGTQWYLLFNVIAGASAIPQDLRHTTVLLQLGRWQTWRTLVLPALFPYIV
ncbi:MAG: ABC transporter permease subunit, partial [Deltaproteobacteria bacterium]|nr:ABC transporter permease subunit [Deltaproteobacteria bacterium]